MSRLGIATIPPYVFQEQRKMKWRNKQRDARRNHRLLMELYRADPVCPECGKVTNADDVFPNRPYLNDGRLVCGECNFKSKGH